MPARMDAPDSILRNGWTRPGTYARIARMLFFNES